MSQKKTPGVYIKEVDAFPPSIVGISTGIPAFLGYSELAKVDTKDVTGQPVRISSMQEFTTFFGGAPKTMLEGAEPKSFKPEAASRFLLWCGMRQFFDNGGRTCWVVSLGGYTTPDAQAPRAKGLSDFTDALEALTKQTEPDLIVAPDAVLLSRTDWATLTQQMLIHCAKMANRMAILDVYDGDQRRGSGPEADVIDLFRKAIAVDDPSYGAAYYPWLKTTALTPAEVDFTQMSQAARDAIEAKVAAEFKAATQSLTDETARARADVEQAPLLTGLVTPPTKAQEVTTIHQALLQQSNIYKDWLSDACAALNLLPPSAAMAGLYAQTDETNGIWSAPANRSLASGTVPAFTISDDDQHDLNVPLDGKAVNAIRAFEGRGTVAWGARTLNGNSNEYRYINARRTVIFLEQSIKLAMQSFIFEANTQTTWNAVQASVDSFLQGIWKQGGLQGATAAEAYAVDIGLGSTMTAQDISDGVMRLVAKVSIVHPGEYIVLTVQQQMVSA